APENRRDLAASLYNLGSVLDELSRWPDAEAVYRRAVELREHLAAEHPDAAEYRSALAESLSVAYSLAQVLGRLGRRAEAEAACRRGIELFERLAADHPDVPGYRDGLAQSVSGLGILLKNSPGRQPEAE